MKPPDHKEQQRISTFAQTFSEAFKDIELLENELDRCKAEIKKYQSELDQRKDERVRAIAALKHFRLLLVQRKKQSSLDIQQLSNELFSTKALLDQCKIERDQLRNERIRAFAELERVAPILVQRKEHYLAEIQQLKSKLQYAEVLPSIPLPKPKAAGPLQPTMNPANAPLFVEQTRFRSTTEPRPLIAANSANYKPPKKISKIRRKLAATKSIHEHQKKIATEEGGYHFAAKPQSQQNKARSLWAKVSSKIIILCKTCFPCINTTKAAWILGFTLFFCLAPQCRSEWHPTERANPARRRLDCPQRRGLRVSWGGLLWLRFLATQERKVPRDARTKINVPKALSFCLCLARMGCSPLGPCINATENGGLHPPSKVFTA
ncbi:MAG: hypothetical protein NT086_02105 [Proteobacteria bacterium]|nr:hypothetical protein [Pseudomonadota bacterium]